MHTGLYILAPHVRLPSCCSCFNIQIFGQSKMRKPGVAAILAKIVARYDLLVIQEIRDKDGDAIKELVELANVQQTTGSQHTLWVSPRLGSTDAKEQYAFLYRSRLLSNVEQHSWDTVNGTDGARLFGERSPHSVVWAYKDGNTVPFTFETLVMHVDPNNVVPELLALGMVAVARQALVPNLLVMGDFNAGGSYLPAYKWRCIRGQL